MEPIISPWIIYFLGVVDNFNIALAIIWIGCGISIGGLFLFATFEEEIELASKKSKKFFIIGIICVIISIFFPSQKTVIGMIVAKNITPINVEKALKSGKEFKNELKKDIIEIIQSATKEEKKK